MKGFHYKKVASWYAIVIIVVFLMLSKELTVNAASLQVTAHYDSNTPTNELAVVLSVNSTSEITMVKYDYKRAANPKYFTENTKKGITVEKNEDGKYSFSVTQNGYVSVIVANAAGEEKLLVFKIKNIDVIAPEMEITSKSLNGAYQVQVSATDDVSKNISVCYVTGAYASATDSVWKKATTVTNGKKVVLGEGKYTFLATDEAGNHSVVIKRFGDTKSTTDEFRAVWIAYLDFKTTGYTKKEFKTQIETMFNEVCAMNMNAVVVHVRPFGDAMYDSNYFPWSRYVSGTQGKDPGFDPLEIMVEEAHKRGLEFHAWLNPYRITSNSTDVKDLSKDNPARIYRTDNKKSNDRNVLTYDGKLYYNPSVKEVQTLIVDGIREIVLNYDVDGIHFDDYFYPTLGKNFTKNFDAPEYETYKQKQVQKNASYLSIADWRRENVNTLVRTIYSTVKKINPDVVFGISPGGFMDALKADDKYYVDFETWLGHDGYIDYLCPQLYWSNEHSIYPYNDILDRFIAATKNPDIKLYVGVGAYKAGIKTEEAAWHKNANVLRNMIRYARNTEQVDGFILYSYKYLISKRDHKAIINMMREFE